MKLFKVIIGLVLWLFGMTIIYVSLRQFVAGAGLFVWLGHLGQGLLAVIVGFALIPGTGVQESLARTFKTKR